MNNPSDIKNVINTIFILIDETFLVMENHVTSIRHSVALLQDHMLQDQISSLVILSN